ncbi:DUF4355 domain-containing protein [Halalkalibacter krulwichiae]|uniref:Uncharacterized protein n=1 Tax=Halalkalibacter krulwichiae TaxID=199441 RepID=A0A1X9MBI3_9BACI|nr:DUF4355 domain-containing protein [Halalkalibacter krulwichiae]ARK30776.1 hypothetical protein BkAM31D_13545 [Halalkalibacter krulwichiae]
MTLEEIKKFLEENKDQEEVKAYLEGLSQVTPEGVTTFLDTEDGKKLLQPRLDSYFSRGLESWKSNNLEKIITDELTKRTSNKDDKDLRYEELERKFQKLEQDKLRETLRNSAFKFASDNSLPTDLIDYFIKIESEDDEKGTKSKEATEANLASLKDVWSSHLQTVVNEKLKSNGFTPKDGDKPTTITREQLQSMSVEEISKLDQSLVDEALAQ